MSIYWQHLGSWTAHVVVLHMLATGILRDGLNYRSDLDQKETSNSRL